MISAGNSASSVGDTYDTPWERAPDIYRILYKSLFQTLETSYQTLRSSWDGVKKDVKIVTDLSSANGNRGPALLTVANMVVVKEQLDSLQAQGVDGVALQLQYPLTMAWFTNFALYRQFYIDVAVEIRARNMTFFCESSPVFAGTAFSGVPPIDYSGLTNQQYFDERGSVCDWIADNVVPDYLSLTHEPGTEAYLTDKTFTANEFIAFVNDTLTLIGLGTGVLFGAGSGAWTATGPYFVNRYATETNVDWINVHMYPVVGTPDPFSNLATMATVAANNGLQVFIGESSLYKIGAGEGAVAAGGYYYRDVFESFAPLDVRFAQTLAVFAHLYNLLGICFFWPNPMNAYLQWTADREAAPTTLAAELNVKAYAARLAGEMTTYGHIMKSL